MTANMVHARRGTSPRCSTCARTFKHDIQRLFCDTQAIFLIQDSKKGYKTRNTNIYRHNPKFEICHTACNASEL